MQNAMADSPSRATAPPPEAAQLARLRALVAADPANERLRQRCAELATAARDYEALLELSRQTLATAPGDPEALHHEATALLGLHRVADARQPLEALLSAQPANSAALLNLGLCHYALRDYAAALPLLERCYAAGERSPDLLRLLVSAYHQVGQIDKAVETATANVGAARGDGAVAGVFALAFLDGDDPARAARCAAYALEHNPESADALIVQGTLRLAQLELERAVRQFSSVLERTPDNGRAWVGLGTASLLNQDFTGAKTALRRGVEHMPQHVGSWHLLAWAELMTGQIDEAERLFAHSFELDRNFAETHGGLATIAALRGDRAAALRSIEVANRLDPNCLAAKYAQSVLARAAGNAEQARELIGSTIAGMTADAKTPLAGLLARLSRR